MLKISNLNASIGDKQILNDITVDLLPGGVLLIVGHNGSGKSTLLHAIMGRYDISVTGQVTLEEKDLLSLPCHERARSGVFMFHQTPPTIDGVNTMTLINEVNKQQGSQYSKRDLIDRSKKLFNELNLPDDWTKRQFNSGASGGERKKNELVQAKLFAPKVLLLDEPDSGLDQASRQNIVDLIKKNSQAGGYTLLVSHDNELQSIYKDNVIELNNGRIV